MEFRDVELVALRDVYLSKLRRPGVSPDFHLRKIFREYSKLFHTPLHVVHELPIEFVVQAWLEEHYETYSMEDLRAEVVEHTRTHEDLMAARRAEDEADAETFLIIQDEARAMKAVKSIRKLEDAVRGMQTALTPFIPKDRDTELASNRTKPKEIPQGITMRFEDVDLDQDSFGILNGKS
jgi:hypothetical protein